MIKRFSLIFLILFFMVSFYSYGEKNIKIAMGYIPNVQFAPYYVAQELGYFRKEGLNVKFDYGMSTDIMSLVSQGSVDFGVSDGDQIIIARSKGLKVKSVYAMYVKYPVCVVSLADRGIRNIPDLKGRKIGVPGAYGSNYIGLKLLLNSASLSLRDIKLISIGYTQVESLLSHKVDAATVYLNNEVVILKEMGKELNVIKVYDVSPMVSAVIMTGDRMIVESPDVVRGFVRAIKRASEYIQKKNGDVMDILKRYIPAISAENIEINRKVLLESMKLWVDKDVKEHGLGYTTIRDWKISIDSLKKISMLNMDVKPEECFTNNFLN